MAKNELDIEDERELPLKQMVTFRVSRINAKITAQASRILKKNSTLSLFQWRVLVSLRNIENPTHSRIATSGGMDGGQLSRCIKSMIADGILESETDKTDSRQQYPANDEKGAGSLQGRPSLYAEKTG